MDEIAALLQEAEGSGRVEFKRSCLWPLEEDEHGVQSVLMRLANANREVGGIIMLGREDDGRWVGLVDRQLQPVTDSARLRAAEQRLVQVAGRLQPSMHIRWYIREVDGVQVVIVRVPGRPIGGWYQDARGVTRTGSASHPVIADPALLQRWAREGDGLAMIEQRRREHLDQLKREIVEPVGNHVAAIAYHLQWFGVNVSRYGYPHGFSGGYTPGFLAGHPLANDWPRHFPQLHADLRAFETAVEHYELGSLTLLNHLHAALTQYNGEQPWMPSLVRATHAYLLGLAGQEYPVQRREFLGKPQLVSGRGGPPAVGWYEITDRWEGVEEDVLRLTSDGDLQWRASELKAQSASLRQRAAEIGQLARGLLYWPYLMEDCPYVDERIARPGSS